MDEKRMNAMDKQYEKTHGRKPRTVLEILSDLQDTKYEVFIHDKPFKQKPTRLEAGTIINELKGATPKLVNTEELIQYIEKGHTINPHQYKDNVQLKENFITTQFLFIDVDNSDKEEHKHIKHKTLREILQSGFVKNNAFCVYRTFSHTTKKNRIRIGFVFNRSVKGADEYLQVAHAVNRELGNVADESVLKALHLVTYGTKFKAEKKISPFKVLNIDLLEKPSKDTIKELTARKNNNTKVGQKANNNLINGINTSKNIELIKNRNIKELQDIIKPEPINVEGFSSAVEQVKHFSMWEILGLDPNTNPFRSIFRTDNNPSCSIYYSEFNIWLYKDFAKETVIDNIQVISRLAKMTSVESMYFLIKLYKIGYEMPKEYQEEIDKLKYIIGEIKYFGRFKEKYKNISNYTRDDLSIIYRVLDHLTTCFYVDKNNKLHCISDLSVREFTGLVYGNYTKYNQVQRALKKMGELEMVLNLKEDEIPREILLPLKERQKKTGHKKLNNTMSLNMDFNYDEANERIKGQKVKNTTTLRGVRNTQGKDKAGKMFAQANTRSLEQTEHDKKVMQAVEELIIQAIDKKGYALKNDIVSELQSTFKAGRDKSILYYDFSIKDILDKYDLQETTCKKEIKEKYNLKVHYNKRIVIKNKWKYM